MSRQHRYVEPEQIMASPMTVVATCVTVCNEKAHDVMFRVGDDEVETVVTESNVNDVASVRTLNVHNRRVCLILTLCGLLRAFGQDFWALRDKSGRPLPWDYGDAPPELLDHLETGFKTG